MLLHYHFLVQWILMAMQQKQDSKLGTKSLYTSFFFGDELRPADKLDFAKTDIKAKPDF
ncbi:unnamed protein product [Musa textilis]